MFHPARQSIIMINNTTIPAAETSIERDEVEAHSTQQVEEPDGPKTDEEWPLADLEYLMPPVFLQETIVFRTNNVDPDEVTSRLKDAIHLASRYCRTLTGVFKKEDGEVSIVRKHGATIPLLVKHDWSSSIQHLGAEGFSGRQVSASAAVEERGGPDADSLTDGRNVCEVRATWITGGLIIALGYHHYCLDGSGSSAFLRLWAKISLALQARSQLPAWDPENLNRDRLRGLFVPPEQREDPLPTPLGALPARAAETNQFVVLRLQQDRISTLKAAATTSSQDKVSSYDAITALVWRVLTRARLRIYRPAPDEATFAGQAVDVRRRLAPALGAELQANATLGVLTPALAVGDAVGPGGLGLLAMRIRRAHAGVGEQTARDAADRVARLRDKTSAAWRGTHAPRFGVAMSDVRGGGLYELDFGFGTPVAVRNVYEPGHPCVMHSLPAGRGVEVQIPVESACLDDFVRDEELSQYADVISA